MTTETHGLNSAAPDRTRVAVIGCGKMGLAHVKAIQQVAAAELVAVADPAADPTQLAAQLPAGVQIFSDPAAMLAEARPDVVHIVTPPATHAPLARLAIDSGIHAYVEKPFVAAEAEAAELLERAAARGVRLCAGHQLLFEPPMARLRAALPLVGDVVQIDSCMAFRTVRRNITPVDQIKDVLPHAVYLLLGAMEPAARGASISIQSIDVQATGEVHARLAGGAVRGAVTVTLNGRPLQHYVRVVGTNGSLHADFITGAVVRLVGPGASAPAVLLNPYLQSWQTVIGATGGFWKRLRSRASYPGLPELFGRFYASTRGTGTPPMAPAEIRKTVAVCQEVGAALDRAQEEAEAAARVRLGREAEALPAIAGSGIVLVTGGTGFLGREVAAQLRAAGHAVRVVGRSVVPQQSRLAGIEYLRADLASPLPAALLEGVTTVVHCAAETAGGKAEHETNSIAATRNLLEAAAAAGVRSFLHVSSVAVLEPGRGRPVSEQVPVDSRAMVRGPYVWGKAEAERLAMSIGPGGPMRVKIVRPGPLVDFAQFRAPGRLGRELGPIYVAIGPARAPLAVCDVGTAARVMRWYVEHFDEAPAVLNLLEAVSPTRRELVSRLTSSRGDLRVVWMPAPLLRVVSSLLTLAQRIVLRGRQPIDVYAAFASERYDTSLAASVIGRAAAEAAGGDQAAPPTAGERSTARALAKGGAAAMA
jgi:predicted dehydrogenase/nucleoside-diphosphate-sugar epimerase